MRGKALMVDNATDNFSATQRNGSGRAIIGDDAKAWTTATELHLNSTVVQQNEVGSSRDDDPTNERAGNHLQMNLDVQKNHMHID